ncbi:CubicO group peptidase (beta-lactamase class C family) [Actinocorallia herbida]|uniref:CubicO group peptidase (Beta-lactamase class C family) n=1 Tax=Actinocorallia herbida TaxID=58109 RepID=A0A3N1D1H4_9ACTN|nr:serine hydrolase domain-containing protein [Actinocorallia herbida]ROO87374.1 CubicO group peptidase (beta-lactamase class C family) [Actinocorallia herbida]
MGRRVLSLLMILVLPLGLASPATAAPPGPSGPLGVHQAQSTAGPPEAGSDAPVIDDASSGGRIVKATTPRPASAARVVDEGYGDDQLNTAPTRWWTVNGWTAEEIYDYAIDIGARISDVAVQPGSQVRFTATLVENAGSYWVSGWALWYGLTEAQVLNYANAYGQRPVSISRYWTSGGWRFAVGTLDNTGAGARAWWWYYGDTNYMFDRQQATPGARPTRIRPFDDGGVRRFDMLMSESSAQWWWWLGGGVGNINDVIRQNGARIVDASRNGDGSFNGIMLRNTTGYTPGWWYGFTHGELNLKALRLGARLITAQGYTEGGRELFIGTMSREAGNNIDLAKAMVQNTVFHTALAHGGGGAVAELSDSVLGRIGFAYGPPQDARTRIASVSKTFAAAELMKLAAAGRVSLDNPVSTYLPGVNGGGSITLRMLLRHTSGLYNFTDALPDFSTTMSQGYTYPQLLAIVNAHAPLFSPGARYSYSNSNYLVIGMIIERVTGYTYADALYRDILSPLQLSGTSVPTGTAISSVRLRGYWWNGSSTVEVTDQNASRWAPGGQMISTVSDVNTFFKNLLNGTITGTAAADQMKTSLVYTGEGSKYAGLGMFRSTWCGKYVYWHDGSIPGYRTWSVHSADGKRSLTWSYSDQRRATDVNYDEEFIESIFCNL